MRFHALAIDYDGTLAKHGRVAPAAVAALERLAATGRRLILVTGRRLPELLDMFPHTRLFDRVVAENGALLYRPKSAQSRLLTAPASLAFVRALENKHVAPLAVGAAIVATVHPNETVVIELIRELGLELHVIFNKGAVMVLPAGITKATGLAAALTELSLSSHEVVALGDAENDHAFLEFAEFSAAVADAVPMLRQAADHVTAGGASSGAIELIEELIGDDLRALSRRARRGAARALHLGRALDGTPLTLPARGPRVLVVGSSGGGKTTFACSLLEQLLDRGYQCCVLDPEGDYQGLRANPTSADAGWNLLELGGVERAPSTAEIAAALTVPTTSIVANLLEVSIAERPAYFAAVMGQLQGLRARYGRPHWIVIDEAHHGLPTHAPTAGATLGASADSIIFITVHSAALAREVLGRIDVLVVLGEAPREAMEEFGRQAGRHTPRAHLPQKLDAGQALLWQSGAAAQIFKIEPSARLRRRHLRKYAQGELGADRSFFFRGPRNALNLRVQNLALFVQIADGIDDATWLHHLRCGDYSRWLRAAVKDEALAQEVQAVEMQEALPPGETRRRICSAITRRYTLSAETS